MPSAMSRALILVCGSQRCAAAAVVVFPSIHEGKVRWVKDLQSDDLHDLHEGWDRMGVPS